MSTTELKAFIDSRTAQEKDWLLSYLFHSRREVVPEIQLPPAELAELQRCAADMAARRNCVSQADAEARWDALDAKEA